MVTKVAIGSDHAGYELKQYIIDNFNETIIFNDFGTNNTESCDYPDYADKVCNFILKNDDYRGVLICGSGVGMSIAANKIQGIRASNVTNIETAIQSVEHNNVNILCLGSNNLDNTKAIDLISSFLSASFTEEERYLRRINKLNG